MTKYNYQPKTKDELKNLIKKLIKERGNEADLNDIDVSLITDMSYLFCDDVHRFKRNGDIFGFEALIRRSMERDMEFIMVSLGEFNGNISKWDVSNVKDMQGMFCYSKFNRDISKWDVSNVKNMRYMFFLSKFNSDISKWNVSNVEDMKGMFKESEFEGYVSNWDTRNVKDKTEMFFKSPLEPKKPMCIVVIM